MDEFEPHIHSFIVKLWLEETIEETGQTLWRGHITHVPSGERRYLKDLEEIAAFIIPHLKDRSETEMSECQDNEFRKEAFQCP